MYSQRDEAIPIEPRLQSENPRIPSSSSPPSVPGISSTLSIFGSSDPPSLSSSLSPEEARLILTCVQSLEEKLQAIMAELEQQRALLERTFRKQGWDTDDEDEDKQIDQPKKKKKKSSESHPLTSASLSKLTEEQLRTRKELLAKKKAHIDKKMKSLTGLGDGKSFLPEGSVPCDSGDLIIPDFKKEVGDDINKRLIGQTSFLAYKDQTDPEKKARAQVKRKSNARKQRQRQRKFDRGKAAKQLATETGIDTSPVLLTDFMSEYLSSRAAGFSPEVDDIEVWEMVRPAFRSKEVNDLFENLDKVYSEKQKASNRRKPTIRRVFIGKMKYDIPTSAPYPFMIDPDWKQVFIDDKGLEDKLKVMPADPKGFGLRKDED
ncbi:hypothetical protein ACEPAI_6904 [Sanghuangporus weigelae]